MIKYLLYEPNREEADGIRSMMHDFFLAMRCDYNLYTYLKWTDVIKELLEDSCRFDVVLVNMCDIRVAKKISETLRLRNKRSALIYLSGNYNNLHYLLNNRPSAYFFYPLDRKKVEFVIYALYQEQNENRRYFLVKHRDVIERIAYDQIDFFESSNRKIMLYTKYTSRIYEFNAKLDDVKNSLNSNRFIRCHQSYLVNLENIQTINKTERCFIMFSGRRVDIAKRSLGEASIIFEQYVKECNS